ncbi:hypothetical protein GGS20DRAFT_21442 [Poronia punctata]|nr:hypothetical protein GGS20DRAFT_21442 [Poronia punctata]
MDLPDWHQEETTISSILDNVFINNKPEAAYVHGNAMSGLNTSFVEFVVEKTALSGGDKMSVVYIAANEAAEEVVLCNDAVLEHVGKKDDSGVLVVKSAEGFWRDACSDTPSPLLSDSVVLLIEVDMRPTAYTELMFSVIIDWLRKRNRHEGRIAILLLGTFLSHRTISTFNRHIPTWVIELPKADSSRYATNIVIDKDGSKIKEIVETAWQDGKRVLFSGMPDRDVVEEYGLQEMPQQIVGIPDSSLSIYKVVRSCPGLQLDAACQISMESDLAVVISSDVINSQVYDDSTSQIVDVTRGMTKSEAEAVKAWARKSSNPVTFVQQYTEEEDEARLDDSEMLGPAWGERLREYALLSVAYHGKDGSIGVGNYPWRDVLHHEALGIHILRLTTIGAMTTRPETGNRPVVTEMGARIIQVFESLPTLHWQASWLVACAWSDKYDKTVRWCLLTMAAVIECVRTQKLVLNLGNRGHYLRSEYLEPLCAPLLRARAGHGIIWFLTGMFLENKEEFEMTARPLKLSNGMLVDRNGAENVSKTFDRLCEFVGISAPTKGWAETRLTSDQLASVEEEIMWAFLHQQIFFQRAAQEDAEDVPGVLYSANDLASQQRVWVEQDTEYLSIDDQRAARGFMAFYMHLGRAKADVVVDRGQATERTVGQYEYIASGLTVIDRHIFQRAVQKTGMPWPNLVVRPAA